jgi:hypothetical protein
LRTASKNKKISAALASVCKVVATATLYGTIGGPCWLPCSNP